MPASMDKVGELIFEEISEIDQRCEEYRDTITETVTDIITLVRQNRVVATNIQQKVNDKCSAAGQFLANSREGKVN